MTADDGMHDPWACPRRRSAFASLLVLALSLGLGACKDKKKKRSDASEAPTSALVEARHQAVGSLSAYHLGEPDLEVPLPVALREISGLTELTETSVACVQDEDGLVYVLDLSRRAITTTVRFGPAGDYEGIARVEASVFVLRSDGVLFELDGLTAQPKVTTHTFSIPTDDNEGLAFDLATGKLLIAPKSRFEKGKGTKHTRPLFAFDPKARAFDSAPVFRLKAKDVRRYAETHAAHLPQKQRKKRGGTKPFLRFKPSAIAVHPKTRELFVVSALDRVLATFDRQGAVTGYALLDAARFPQPEGLAFLPSGALVVSSEGDDGNSASVFVFRPRPGSNAAL